MEANKIIMYKDKPCIKARVVMLPTERSNMCKLINLEDNSFEIKLQPNKDGFKDNKSHGFHIQPFELYIITDEKIEEGDWLIVNNEDVMQMKSSYDNDMSNEDIWVGNSLNGYATYRDNCKKIIATTDTSLKTEIDGYRGDLLPDVSFDIELPQPSQAFIEAYCKAGGIDEVLVEVEPVVFGEVDGEIIYDWEHKIKTNSHNSITIHPVEEKMYSREEVEQILNSYFLSNVVEQTISTKQWIEENLK